MDADSSASATAAAAGAPPRSGPGFRAAVLLLFLLSGATALVYEVSWTRRLVLLVGSTSAATALLLAAWMLGLALGARLGGPWADRSRRPLRLYALLEVGAAGAAMALPFLLDGLASSRSLVAFGSEPLLFGLAFLVLLLPTTLLGATLPALTRTVIDDPERVGSRIGLLYAANTFGAVLGAVGAGFVLVEAFGVDGSARVAVGLNLAIALVAWGLSRSRPPQAAATAQVAATAEAATDAPGARAQEPAAAVVRTASLAAFAAGFVGLAAEVVWTRLLVFILQGFTATFAAMLGAFLLGSAIGGAVFGRAAERCRRPLAMLAWLQVGVAVAAAGALVVLHHQWHLMQSLRRIVLVFDTNTANHKLQLLVAATLVLGPPAFLMGGVFPVAARAAAGRLGDLGARVGRLYAWNTVGAVLGSLAAGFVGIPLLGARPTAAAVAVLSLAAGVVTMVMAARAEPAVPGTLSRPRRAGLVGLAAAATAVLLMLGHPEQPMILRSGVFLGARGRENRLVAAQEGKSGLASVIENERNDFTSLYTDEFLAASTEGRYRYMRMLGHIPMVLAKDPKRVLVMAFGTGTTAGSLSTHPTVERLDIVEISPEVLEMAPYFESVNRGVLRLADAPGPPEVRVHVEDARRFVLASDDTWDVITLEPLLPYTPGAVHLYTREFYELCRARLSDGGAMCQWFPVHSMSSDDFAMLTAAFVDVFPQTSLWFIEETVALVGTKGEGPQPLPVAQSIERLSHAGPREDLAAGRLDDLAQWWSFRMCGGETLRAWLDEVERRRGVTAMTDEHPDLEFRPVPTGTLTTFLHDNLVVALDLRDRERIEERVDLAGLGPADAAGFRERLVAASEATAAYLDGRASEDVFGFHASHTRLAEGGGARAQHERQAIEALRTAVRRYADAMRINPRDRVVADRWRSMEMLRLLNEGRALLVEGRADEAVETYREATRIEAPWNRDEAWTGLARALLRQGRPASAVEALETSLGLFPGGRDGQALMGQALVELGRPGEGRAWFEAAYAGGSGPSDEDAAMHNARAKALEAEPVPGSGPGPDGGLQAGGVAGGGASPADAGAAEERRRDDLRRVLHEALADLADGDGLRRRRAAEIVRGVEERDADLLEGLLAPFRAIAGGVGAGGGGGPADVPAAERVRALSVLAAARDPRLGGVVAVILGDEAADPALRAAAVDAAGEAGDAAVLAGVLGDAALGAPLRSRAADRLAVLRQPEAVDAVLDALADPDESIRLAATAALFQLTGRKDFDPSAAPAARDLTLEALRTWWLETRPTWR